MTDKSPGDGRGKGEAPTQQMPRVEQEKPADASKAAPGSSGSDRETKPAESAAGSAQKPAEKGTGKRGGNAEKGSGASATPATSEKADKAEKADKGQASTSAENSSTSEKSTSGAAAAGAKPDTSSKPEPMKKAAGADKKPSVSARQPLSRPTGGGTSSGAPRKPLSGLSKDEYARTTASSPDTTSVIPAVKDDGPEEKPATEAEKKPSLKDKIAEKTPAVKEKLARRKPAKAEPEPEPVAPPAPAAAEPAVEPASGSPNSAALRLRYLEPWSVTKMSFVVSVALMIVAVVAAAVFWLVLQVTGVWGALNDSVTNILSDDAGSFDITDYFSFGRLVGLTLVLSALNVVFMTALATIGAHLYNLSASILGGVKVTFLEDQR